MRWAVRVWIVLALLLLAPALARAQGLANTDFNMLVPNAPPSTGSSFPPAGCVTANGVIYNNATPCDSGFTYAGSGGGVAVVSGSFGLSGNISAAAWTTNGARYKNVAATLTDTSSSGTVASAYTDVFGGNTIAASSATTYTNYATMFLSVPVAGTNVTFTNKWSLLTGGGVSIASGLAAGAQTMLLVNPASASGLLADFQVGGASKTRVYSDGTLEAGTLAVGTSNAAANITTAMGYSAGGAFEGMGNGYFGLYSTTTAINGTLDTVLQRDAAGIFAVSQGRDTGTVSNPASMRIYHDASSSLSVYSRMAMGFHTSHPTIASIDVEAATSTLPGFGIYIGGNPAFNYAIARGSTWTFFSSNNSANAQVGAGTYYINTSASGDGTATASYIDATGFYGRSTGSFGLWSGTNTFTGNADTLLTRAAAANWQFGAANVNGAPVAQTISFQGALAASATNTASANTTIIGSLGTGTGTNGDIIFQTGVKTTTGTAQATATTALTIKGETQSVVFSATDASASSGSGALQVVGGGSVAKRFWLPAITTSSGLQTAVLCQSSGGEVIADSVACLASSERFKEHILPSDMGLETVMALQPVTYDYRLTGNDRFDNAPNQRARQVGFLAEQAQHVDQRLVAVDSEGNVRTFRYEQYTAVMTKAMQELKADNDNMRAEIEVLRRSIAR